MVYELITWFGLRCGLSKKGEIALLILFMTFIVVER